MQKRLKLLGVSLGVVALLVMGLSGTVFADTPEGESESALDYCAGYGWHGFQNEAGVCSDAVVELLGLTAEEIHEQREAGKSLVEIAVDQGVSEDELIEAMMAAKREAVEAKVADGTLTAEQAELVLQQMEERTSLAANRTTTGPTEWSGGCGYGQASESAGPGLANSWGARNGGGTCYGDEGLGSGPGGMHKWGRGAR